MINSMLRCFVVVVVPGVISNEVIAYGYSNRTRYDSFPGHVRKKISHWIKREIFDNPVAMWFLASGLIPFL